MSQNISKLLGQLGEFKGKTVFISGASRGIGKAIALAFASRGANIVVTGKTGHEGHSKLPGSIYETAKDVESAGGKALPVLLDVRQEENIVSAVEQTVKEFGPTIDVLVNNASAISLTNTLETPMKKFDLMHSVNVRATYLCSKFCHPYLKKAENPHIINLSPPLNMDKVWFRDHVAYTMSKYGMSMCALGMSEEFKKDRIGVNALWPKTAIATEAMRMLGGDSYEVYKRCRKPSIVADCALLMALKPSTTFTGNFILDETFLTEQGVADLDDYSFVPGNKDFIIDFFLEGSLTLNSEIDKSDKKDVTANSNDMKDGTLDKSDKCEDKKKSTTGDLKSLNHPELSTLFDKLNKLVGTGKYNYVNKTCQFAIAFDDGNSEFWYFDSNKTHFSRSSETSSADIYVKANIQNFLSIMNGNTSPTTAYMLGTMKFKGSMSDVKTLMEIWSDLNKH